MKLWKEFLETNSIKEDAPANMASGGEIAALGDDREGQPGSGEPGFDPKKKKKKSYYDGRTKGYRVHREKLEAAREKREERRVAKEKEFADEIKNKTLKMSYPSNAIIGGTRKIPGTERPVAALNKK